jgi:hypothetical protein
MITNERDVMIDIETLATGPNAVILTIGALRFNPYVDDSVRSVHDMETFYCRIDPESFDWPEAEINEDTLKWWSKQPPEIQHEAFGEGVTRLHIREALEQLFDFCRPLDRVWANGPAFDIVILESAAKRLNIQLPWSFWQARDCRTVFRMLPQKDARSNNHNALDDCYLQTLKLQKALKFLNVQKMD